MCDGNSPKRGAWELKPSQDSLATGLRARRFMVLGTELLRRAAEALGEQRQHREGWAAMGRLIYGMNVSLDGYVETPDHRLDWSDSGDEVHAWWNDRVREADACLYGRRLYEVMNDFWPTAEAEPDLTPVARDFAQVWNAKPKIVFSRTLHEVGPNARLVEGDIYEELARLREQYPGDLDLGGPTLAASFIRRGLVDLYRLVVNPVAIGAGTPFFPQLDAPLRLRLTQTHRFGSGAVLLEYEPVRD